MTRDHRDGEHIGWCEVHGKRLYARRCQARKVIRQLPNRKGMREYPCTEVDGHYHVGHLPPATVYGFKTANEVYGEGAA